jgi:hypothetical protein
LHLAGLVARLEALTLAKAQADKEKAEAEARAQLAEAEKAQAVAEKDKEKAQADKEKAQAENENYAKVHAGALSVLFRLGAALFVPNDVANALAVILVSLDASLSTVESATMDRISRAMMKCGNVEAAASSVASDDEKLPVSYRTGRVMTGLASEFPSKPSLASAWTDFSKVGVGGGELCIEAFDYGTDDAPPEWFESLTKVLDRLITLLWVSVNVHQSEPIRTFAAHQRSAPSAAAPVSSASTASADVVESPFEKHVQLVIARVLQVCGQYFEFDVLNATGGPSLFLHEWAGFPSAKGRTDLLLWFRNARCLAVMVEVKVAFTKSMYVAQFFTSLAALTCGRNATWRVDDVFAADSDSASIALPIGLLFNGQVMLRARLSGSASVRSDTEFVFPVTLWGLFRSLQDEAATQAGGDASRSGAMSPGKRKGRRRGDGDDDGRDRGDKGGAPAPGRGDGGKECDKSGGSTGDVSDAKKRPLQPLSLSAFNVLAHSMDAHGEWLRQRGILK